MIRNFTRHASPWLLAISSSALLPTMGCFHDQSSNNNGAGAGPN
ncbi:MAG TPA: hypothetical protein VGC54_14570 [Planctomycetota bacterium]